jgi:GTP cyclohydrolase FolE2
MIPVDYDLDVSMEPYMVGGLFSIPIEEDGERALFTNPQCSVSATLQIVKAHMNRMITSLEYAREDAQHNGAVDVWEFVELATKRLQDAHHGTSFRAFAEADIARDLQAHLTQIPSTQKWGIGVGYVRNGEKDKHLFRLKTRVFTTCPFVLWETGGKQSHTQRTDIEINLTAPARVLPGPIMREINTRLVPVMSAMQIPDEVVQVLKSFSGPSFTEDAAVRVVKIVRGIKDQFLPDSEESVLCNVRVVSEDSHLAHDVVTQLETELD